MTFISSRIDGHRSTNQHGGTAPRQAMRDRMFTHKLRCRSPGAPSEAEVARLVAEYRNRGGQVTRCTDGYAAAIQNGVGKDAERWTP